MNAYFVISEELKAWNGSEFEPPEYGHIWEIVVARNGSQAKYLAWKASKDFNRGGGYDVREMPRFATRKLGSDLGAPRVLSRAEAEPWWVRVPDKVRAPGSQAA